MDQVNAQVTDAVTQTNDLVLGEAPAMATAVAYQTMAHATGIVLLNAASNQQTLNQLNPAIVAQAVATILAANSDTKAAVSNPAGL